MGSVSAEGRRWVEDPSLISITALVSRRDNYKTPPKNNESPLSNPHLMIIAKMSQDRDAGASPSRSWTYFSQACTLLLAGFTLGIPSFHKSLASKESPLGKFIASFLRHLLGLLNLFTNCSGLPDTINVWKATRIFASLLFGCVPCPIILCHSTSDTLSPGY